jgi:hypothetical protein
MDGDQAGVGDDAENFNEGLGDPSDRGCGESAGWGESEWEDDEGVSCGAVKTIAWLARC